MRALIVDDSPTARAQARVALEEAVERLGLVVDVDEAGGGVEALRVLTSEDVDVLIVDLHMPDVHGLEVLSFWRGRLKARQSAGGSGVHCAVVVSTEVSQRDREKALEHGAVSFVDKPVSGSALEGPLAALSSSSLPARPPVTGR